MDISSNAHILPGDPLMFALHAAAPRVVPVERFGFLNFVMLVFVTDENRHVETIA